MTQQLTQEAPPLPRPSLWRSRNFLLLWGGQTVSEVGTRISGVTVPLLAAATLDATVFQVSLLTFLAWLPYLLFSLPAGMVADRVDQRRLMIACDLGRAALMLSVPVAALAGADPPLPVRRRGARRGADRALHRGVQELAAPLGGG